ncbi:MAG: XRE family transcriptional regulator [Comamonadaceae bacterium]|nr:MAG: XRE family transcriptional regulator [Comamonadaceae bacterium]
MPPAAKSKPRHAPVRELLALNLIRLRGARDWSQEDLALECGLHRTFVAHVERQARNISLDNLDKLAKAFGLQAYELLMPGSQEVQAKNVSQ